MKTFVFLIFCLKILMDTINIHWMKKKVLQEILLKLATVIFLINVICCSIIYIPNVQLDNFSLFILYRTQFVISWSYILLKRFYYIIYNGYLMDVSKNSALVNLWLNHVIFTLDTNFGYLF